MLQFIQLLLLIILIVFIQSMYKTDKCDTIPGIESIITSKYPITFIINTQDKDKIINSQNKFLSKIKNGTYCDTYLIDFYPNFSVTYSNQDIWINKIPIQMVSKKIRKIYDNRKKPIFQVSYKCYSFFVDYEKSISMDILTDIVYDDKYHIHFNILTLFSPRKWKKWNLHLGIDLQNPVFTEFDWTKYFNENIS